MKRPYVWGEGLVRTGDLQRRLSRQGSRGADGRERDSVRGHAPPDGYTGSSDVGDRGGDELDTEALERQKARQALPSLPLARERRRGQERQDDCDDRPPPRNRDARRAKTEQQHGRCH